MLREQLEKSLVGKLGMFHIVLSRTIMPAIGLYIRGRLLTLLLQIDLAYP